MPPIALSNLPIESFLTSGMASATTFVALAARRIQKQMLRITVANRKTGDTYYLRSTIWTASEDRASTFATHEDALAGIERARKFSKPISFKRTYTDPVIAEGEG
jgi:hypothetical protein